MDAAWLYYLNRGALCRQRLRGARLVIGSASDCGLVLRGVGVAPRHAVLMAGEAGWRVSPLSEATVWIGRRPCRVTRLLRDGETLRIGEHPLRYAQPRARSSVALQLGICEPDRAPRFVLIDAPEVRIGGPGADVQLTDPSAIGAWATIERPTPDALIVSPSGPEGAVRLDSRVIRSRAKLADGGVIALGSSRVVVRLLRGLRLPGPGQPVWRPDQQPQLNAALSQRESHSVSQQNGSAAHTQL